MDDDYFSPEFGDDSDDESETQADLESGWEPERPGAWAAFLQAEDPQQADDRM